MLSIADIDEKSIDKVMGKILNYSINEADIYFQTVFQEFWLLEDGQVKDASYHEDKGVGVRAVSGEKTGFAYSDEISLQAIEDAANAVKQIGTQGQSISTRVMSPSERETSLYGTQNPLHGISIQEKIEFLQDIDRIARHADPRITQVNATLACSHETVLIVSPEGGWQADIRPLVRINVSVLAEQEGRRERGNAGGGGRFEFDILRQKNMQDSYAKEAARQALVNLEAGDAPAGSMTVVLGPGWPGILLHEAVGHGLEGDFNRKGTSIFSNRIGERVAAPGVTVVDNGHIPDRRGSLNIDDEGTLTQENVLIEDGILKGYMCDKMNGRLLGCGSTGNGRRESYAHMPMPRMTNTYMLAGQHEPQEIISSVNKGIYAVNFGGGQVDITSGQFVFSASEAYMIENGRITRPIRGATLIGCGPEALKYVSMIGHDMALDDGVGVCGKDGQSVPVGVGQPTIKIDAMTVGGTQVDS